MRNSKVLALFDFDGTITTCDTYSVFLKKITPKWRFILTLFFLSPFIYLYKKGYISAPSIRKKISRFVLFNVQEDFVINQAKIYVDVDIPRLIRSDVMQTINWHKKEGHRIIIVSASLDPYMKIWAKNNNLETICTQLERKGKKLTGKYVGLDCSGEEKVNRIKRKLDLSKFDKIFAYGDSEEDFPMLSLANNKIYKGKDFEFSSTTIR